MDERVVYGESGNVIEVFRSASLRRSQRWRWRLVAANGNIIADSAEGYANRSDAELMARKVVSGTYAAAPMLRVGRGS